MGGELCRPLLTEQGPLAIADGRHPLLELMLPAGQFQVTLVSSQVLKLCLCR